MKKIFLTIAAITLLISFSNAQILQWQRSLGGTYNDGFNSIQQTNDGNYICAGNTESNVYDVSGNHGSTDFWVVKLSSTGNIIWQKCLGGSSGDGASSIFQTFDNGYIVLGTTQSNDGDVSGYYGNIDIWVVKLDPSGNIQWQKTIGGTGGDYAGSIKQTSDGGYILVGSTNSNNGDVSGLHGSIEDIWVVKLDSSGSIQWQKTLGGSDYEYGSDIEQAIDGGYIVVGNTISTDGDVTGLHSLYYWDYWIVKLDSTGNIQWQKVLGGTNDDYAYSIDLTIDRGYIIAGYSDSEDGDVTHNYGSSDFWIVKTDSIGNIIWQRSYGGYLMDYPNSIQKSSDGGYIVAGTSFSYSGDVSENKGQCDYWILKLNCIGGIQWQKSFGGNKGDYTKEIQQTNEGGYIVAGQTNTLNNGDVTNSRGQYDCWVVKINIPNISGIVYNDFNSNGTRDSLEQGVAQHLLKIEPGPFYTSTNNDGYYMFYRDTGNYKITYIPQQYWSVTSDSTSYSITLSDSSDIADTLNFGVKAKLNTQDVGIYLTGNPVRPGFQTRYWINYKNWGTIDMNGTFSLAYDTLLSFIDCYPLENNQTGNILDWNYDTLANNEDRNVFINFSLLNAPITGDTLVTSCFIEPIAGDTNVTDNYDTLVQIITGSHDPNDKLVSPAGKGFEGYVLHGQKLIYTVRFQNTGTDTAFTVRIKDFIDSDMDIESFQFLASSHPVVYTIGDTGTVRFTFNNILLPDSNVNEPESHGFVKYSVKPKQGLPDYTQVTNKADIYFDYNPAVVTNEVLNTYVTTIPVGIAESIYKDNNVNIYPNPASDRIFIVLQKECKNTKLEIFNTNGQLLMNQNILELKTSIDISTLPKGIYFIKLMNEKEVMVEKFVKE
jgi:uncharacterized repeat protein (TIGR01451 family)